MKKILNFLKILGLIIGCLGITFLFVWPLWKFALSAPVIYTWVISIMIIAFFTYLIIKKIINHSKK